MLHGYFLDLWKESNDDDQEGLVDESILFEILRDGPNDRRIVIPVTQLSFDPAVINLLQERAPG